MRTGRSLLGERRLIDEVIIPARFNGPPTSANGGYACGLLAAAIGPSARVRLSQPPPLDVPMTRRREEDGARWITLRQDAGYRVQVLVSRMSGRDCVSYPARTLIADVVITRPRCEPCGCA